jgi:hypothetical protein
MLSILPWKLIQHRGRYQANTDGCNSVGGAPWARLRGALVGGGSGGSLRRHRDGADVDFFNGTEVSEAIFSHAFDEKSDEIQLPERWWPAAITGGARARERQ